MPTAYLTAGRAPLSYDGKEHNMSDISGMTPQQALKVLSDVTEPANAGKITRAGYVMIEQALVVLQDLIASQAEKKDQVDEQQ
jgi:hypothetical protein